MKQRILVLNGQRLIEQLENDEWKTIKVAKAEELTGGVYNIFTARDGDTKTESPRRFGSRHKRRAVSAMQLRILKVRSS